MTDLLKKKQEAVEEYEFFAKMEREITERKRKARLKMLEANDKIKAYERDLAEGVTVIYGKELEGVVNIYA